MDLKICQISQNLPLLAPAAKVFWEKNKPAVSRTKVAIINVIVLLLFITDSPFSLSFLDFSCHPELVSGSQDLVFLAFLLSGFFAFLNPPTTPLLFLSKAPEPVEEALLLLKNSESYRNCLWNKYHFHNESLFAIDRNGSSCSGLPLSNWRRLPIPFPGFRWNCRNGRMFL